MTLVLSWVVYPLLLTLLSLGLGLLVERACGARWPAALLLPLGLAAALVTVDVTTAFPLTARLTVPALALLAAAGFILQRGDIALRHRLFGDRAGAIALLGVFAVYALPILMTGTATFAGWIKLDDGATWLALSDQLITAGHTTEGLAPSTREALLATLWGTSQWNQGGYPSGVFPLIGAGATVLPVDAVHLLQPYLTFMAAAMASGLLAVLRPVLGGRRRLRAVGVFLAAQAALLYGYVMWGGIKEIAIAALLPAAAVVAVETGRSAERSGWLPLLRTALAPALLTAALWAVAGVAGLVWAVVPGLVWLWLLMRTVGWARAAVATGFAVALLAALAVGELIRFRVSTLLSQGEFAAGSDDIGTLWGKLRSEQVAGIWPIGDFRATPEHLNVTWVLIAIVVLLAALGAALAWQRRTPHLLVYVAGTVPLALVFAQGGAWIGGKALAMASPALLTAAVAGVAWLLTRRRQVEAALAGGVVAVGVIVSTATQYHEVWLAPEPELAELAEIGRSQASYGPALITDYSPYAARHLLRQLDTQGAGELRRDLIPLLTGVGLDKSAYANIDEFMMSAVQQFRTLVLRRSVTASRPPSNFGLVFSGESYEVWRRDDTLPVPTQWVPAGTWDNPAGIVPCPDIRALATTAPQPRQLAVAGAGVQVDVNLTAGDVPEDWGQDAKSGKIWPNSSGEATYQVNVPQDGSYYLMLRGGFFGRVRLAVDGAEVFDQRHHLTWNGHGVMGPQIPLTAGTHTVTLTYNRDWWAPGSGGQRGMSDQKLHAWSLGPLFLGTQTAANTPVTTVPATQWRSLCRQRVDWIESLS